MHFCPVGEQPSQAAKGESLAGLLTKVPLAAAGICEPTGWNVVRSTTAANGRKRMLRGPTASP